MRLTPSQIFKILPLVPPKPYKTFASRLFLKIKVLLDLINKFILMQMRISGARYFQKSTNGNHILKLNRETPLGKKNSLVELPKDTVIYNHVLLHGYWELIESEYLAQLFDNSGSSSFRNAFLDIGANSGLISIQVSNLCISDFDLLLVEPLPRHIDAINFNLKMLKRQKKVKIYPVALGSQNGDAVIYTEFTNYGNTSLLPLMVPQKLRLETKITEKNISDFCNAELPMYDKLVIKCDTQGMDSFILSRFPPEIWNKVVGGIIEISPDENRANLDFMKLLNVLEKYPKLSWSENSDLLITTAEILDFWNSGSNIPKNLYFQ